ncbi:MAG: acyl carrier protein [Cyanobacteria bacterium RYN_339]|nr:acyl carrier protein [Cyanobacteria bacterium RYN_339]
MATNVDTEKFFDCFVQSLGVDRSDLSMDKRLLEDLGADSLDLLDLVFNLEQAFNISIPRGEFEKRAREKLGDQPFEVNGVITEDGLQGLREAMPEAAANIKPGMRTHQIPMLFTVESFFNMVAERVATPA